MAETFENFGVVFPPRPPQPLPAVDSRTHALRAFADFLATLQFRIPGDKGTGQTIAFKVPRKNIHVEQPDDVVDLSFPAIAFIPGRGTYDYFGLGPPRLIDESLDVFAPGTAVLTPGDYIEQFTIEVWGSKKGERRAIIAGIEAAMTSEETSTAVRLVLEDFFGMVARFDLLQRENLDEADAVRNRRRGHLFVQLTVCLAQLVNVTDLKPYVQVEAVDSTVEAQLALTEVE